MKHSEEINNRNKERGIFPVYCTSYFCVKCVLLWGLKNKIWSIPRLKNEVSFKWLALDMGCLLVQDFKNEAYILYTVLHIFVLSAFFFSGLKNDIWSIPRLKNEVSFKSFAFDTSFSASWL